MSSHQMAIRHSSAMRWTIPGKSYLSICHITFHKLRIYLRSNGQVLLCCIIMFMLTGMRENAYDIVCRARWVFSALVSESSPRLSGSGWIQKLKHEPFGAIIWLFLSGCNGAQTCAYVLNLLYNFKFSAIISKCL